MKRLLPGMVPLLAILVGVSCSSDPLGDLQNGVSQLVATPTEVFLELGGTKTVEVGGLDAQGNPQSLDYQVTAVGSGITVTRDSTFRPNFVNDSTLEVPSQAPSFRFIVTANAYTSTSFTVSAGGKDVVVQVQVVPRTTLQAQISNLNPAIAEPVTVTAPAGITFSPTSTVTLGDSTAVQPAQVTVAADGKTITFLAPPNLNSSQLFISDVVSDGAPGLKFKSATSDRLTSPELKVLDAAISNLTPAVNEAITVTVNNATFDPAAAFTLNGAPLTVLDISGNVATLLPSPSSLGLLTVNGVIADSLPMFTLSLTSPATDTVTVGPAVQVAGTDAPATAPSLSVPQVGGSTAFYDVPDFAATADHFYKLVVPANGDYTITMDWDVGSDIDMFVCPSPGAITGACDFSAATSDQPESSTFTLTAGTYYVVADDFGADANGAKLTITVER